MKLPFIKILTASLTLTFVLTALPFQVFAERMTSSNYTLESDTVNFAGGRSASGSYSIEDTAGEIGTGDLSSTNENLSAGYQQAEVATPTPTPSTSPSGGGGSGGVQSSVAAPAFSLNVMDFMATAGETSILLDWIYPIDSAITGVTIVRSDTFYPASLTDGEVVFQGNTEEVIDHDVVPGKTYYYALFAHDAKGVYSSGVLASARIVVPGETVPKSKNPFENIPQAENVNSVIAALTLADFDFIQDGRKIEHAGSEIVIDAKKNLTVRLDYKKVPEILKTIAVTLGDPQDSSKVFTFLLRVTKDKTAYEATIASLGRSGKYELNAVILDYGNQGLKRLNGDLRALVLGSGADVLYKISKNPALLWGMILLLILAFALIVWLVRRQRQHGVALAFAVAHPAQAEGAGKAHQVRHLGAAGGLFGGGRVADRQGRISRTGGY